MGTRSFTILTFAAAAMMNAALPSITSTKAKADVYVDTPWSSVHVGRDGVHVRGAWGRVDVPRDGDGGYSRYGSCKSWRRSTERYYERRGCDVDFYDGGCEIKEIECDD